MTPEETEAVEAALGEPIVDSRKLAGGFSHETWALVLESGRAVVRLGGGAPGVEAAVMERGTELAPVPPVRVVQESAVGDVRPFMVIDYIDGRMLDDLLADPDADGLRTLGSDVARVARRIGSLTIASRPGFFADPALHVRAERPWSEQLAEFAAECMAATPDERLNREHRRAWAKLCAAHAPALTEVDSDAQLVHSDFNPKNILVAPAADGWRVASVLDWEFAYAGCPYADAANMLRFADEYPPAYVEGFRAEYAEGMAPEDAARWEFVGIVLDMFALTSLVTRPIGHSVADQAAGRIRVLLDGGLPGRR
ncbi:phosphotransferase family protein [Solicola gregarius]|uniref:Phosphotransferase n=1 Tax=Solicola gregarius TaxID=2908642 RepID=A0AA46TGT8_9ACTN|nr:phosphotransferase [Solicola gregarius]UYM05092.1 phosphotransferase [Solicola gregarius]